ncbi:MAG TPA: DMT family transporter [Acidimicrobiia bacterium]|jgi:drug/metabolite transporter (DMT)-like permease
MAVLLGVLVAASFGSGDFFGGLASRRAAVLNVLVVVQVCAVAGAVVYALALGGGPTGRDLGLGAGAGVLNVIALGALYAGLATGRMGVVAPLTAVIAACIPVVWGLANGEQLSTVTFAGVLVAIAAGGLIARERDESRAGGVGRALAYAAVAGTLFGWSFVLYSETGDGSGAWPALSGRIASVVLVVGVVAIRAWPPRVDIGPRRLAVVAGLLDVSATALLLVAVREGLTSVVAPVAALGPAFTVMWAWIVLHERVGRLQLVGLVAAVGGLAMIAAG